MLAKFENVRVLETGAYDIEGASWPWIDCYDPEGKEKVVRFGVHREKDAEGQMQGPDVSGVEFGDVVDLVCDVRNETKVLKGTDRTYVRHNVRVQHLQPAKSSANGRVDKAATAAAA